MVVLPTLNEDDLKDIGVISFGIRRKIAVLVKQLVQPTVEPSVCHPLSNCSQYVVIDSASLYNIQLLGWIR